MDTLIFKLKEMVEDIKIQEKRTELSKQKQHMGYRKKVCLDNHKKGLEYLNKKTPIISYVGNSIMIDKVKIKILNLEKYSKYNIFFPDCEVILKNIKFSCLSFL